MSTLIKNSFAKANDTVLLEVELEDSYAIEEDLQLAFTVVANTEEAIDKCTDVLIGLEDFSNTIETTLVDGGLTPQSAVMVNTSLTYMGNSIGVNFTNELPGLELYIGSGSNDSQSSNTATTQGTLAKLKEFGIKVWEAIKAFIRKWVTGLQTFYKIFVASYILLKVKAKLLLNASKSWHPEDIRSDDVTISQQQYNSLITNGSLKNIGAELDRISLHSKKLGLRGNLYGILNDQNKFLIGLNYKKEFTEEDIKDLEKNQYGRDVLSCIAELGTANAMSYEKISDSEFVYKDSKPYIGEMSSTIKLKLADDNNTISTSVLVTRELKDTESKDKKVPALSFEVIEDIITSVIFSCDALIGIDEETVLRFGYVLKAMATSDQLARKLDKASPEDRATKAYAVAKKYILDFSTITKLLIEPGLSFQKQTADSAKAAYNYCAKNYHINIKPRS